MRIKNLVLVIIVLTIIGFIYTIFMFFYIYPPLNEYSFEINNVSLEENLTNKIKSKEGWSISKKDILKRNKKTTNYFEIGYEKEGEKKTFECKIEQVDPFFSSSHSKLGVIGVFDDIKKTGGYKLSEPDVARLLKILDSAILNNLKGKCK